MQPQAIPHPPVASCSPTRWPHRHRRLLLTIAVGAPLALLGLPAARLARTGILGREALRQGRATILQLRGTTVPARLYAPHEVVVRYTSGTSPRRAAHLARAAGDRGGAGSSTPVEADTRLIQLRSGVSVPDALARLRHRPGVVWAVPNYTAHAAAAHTAQAPPPFDPDDPGRAGTPGGWSQTQWNFAGEWGVDAPQAWANLQADGHNGGRGVTVAVLDTGVAYSNRGPWRRSPDLSPYSFVAGYDFIAHSPYAYDRNGHGTDVASTIAEATDNGRGLTGLAYGVKIMPVRVLDTEGEGNAVEIAKGVRFAVNRGAKVINMSLEFSNNLVAADIPELLSALRYAHHRGVVVVAAAGNEGSRKIPYPARFHDVVSVGATTEHGCLASYSNYGKGVDLVAPGGGPDADIPGDPNCHPQAKPGRDIYQVTITGSTPRHFGIPSGYEGTSMACPHVSATAALIIASGILGPNPTPGQILGRMTETAQQMGGARDHGYYGAGLLDAATATESVTAAPPA